MFKILSYILKIRFQILDFIVVNNICAQLNSITSITTIIIISYFQAMFPQ